MAPVTSTPYLLTATSVLPERSLLTSLRHVVRGFVLTALLATTTQAAPRSYLSLNGGAKVLTGDIDGDVVTERTVGQVELGIGSHVTDDLLFEFTYGVLGSQQVTGRVPPITFEESTLPDHLRAFRIEVNPIMFRLRWASSGMRTGYLKPEFSLGLGMYSVSRWLRPLPPVEPEVASDLLVAFELGASALFVLGKNWAGYVGPRYTVTQRTDLIDDMDHLDGLSVLVGFRFFLNSPRDEFEPPDPERDTP